MFIYIQANTPGCTKQAQCFRDAKDEWTKAGYSIFGLSADSPNAQRSWASVRRHVNFKPCDSHAETQPPITLAL